MDWNGNANHPQRGSMTIGAKEVYAGTVTPSKASSVTLDIEGTATNATISAAAASSIVVSAVAKDSTVNLVAKKATDLNVTAEKSLTLLPGGSDLSALESLTVNTGGTFAYTNALAAISSVTLEGSGSVNLDNLGAATQNNYGITLAATGLSTNNATGSNSVSLKVGSISTDGTDISVNAAGVLGAVNIGAIDSVGSTATTAGNVTVNLDGTGGNINLTSIKGNDVTVYAAGALGTTNTFGTITVEGSSLTFTGVYLASNTVTVAAEGKSFTGKLTGGLSNDSFTITGASDTVTYTLSGDLGIQGTGADSIALNAAAGASSEKIDLSGLTGVESATITAGTSADTITIGDGIGTAKIYGGNGADTYKLGAGTDLIEYTATTVSALTAEVGSGETVSGFTSGTDSIVFAASAIFSTSANTNAAALTAAASGSILTMAAQVYELTAGTVANASSSGVVATFLSNSAYTIAGTSSVVFTVTDGTDSYVWLCANNAATAVSAGELTLLDKVSGVTAFTNGSDFKIL